VDREDFIRRAYTAVNDRDLDAALALMQPDVVWANGMDGGHVHGHEGVREYWTQQWQEIHPELDVLEVEEVGDDRVAVEVNQMARDAKTGAVVVDGRIRHVFTLRDGKIERFEIEKPKLGFREWMKRATKRSILRGVSTSRY
jgi:ketosteroid isomerase-like protein